MMQLPARLPVPAVDFKYSLDDVKGVYRFRDPDKTGDTQRAIMRGPFFFSDCLAIFVSRPLEHRAG